MTQHIIYHMKSDDFYIVSLLKHHSHVYVTRIDAISGAVVFSNQLNHDVFPSLQKAQEAIFQGKPQYEASFIRNK